MALNLSERGDLAEAAAHLFSYLRRLDASGAATIAVARSRARGSARPSTTACGGPRRSVSYPFSFAAICATWRPWKRAPASSFSLGWRWPWPPAMVVAP
jgi:hypothetical protein